MVFVYGKTSCIAPNSQAKRCEITCESRVLCVVAIFANSTDRGAAKSLIPVHLCVDDAVRGNQIDIFRAGTGVSGVNGGRRLCHSVADS